MLSRQDVVPPPHDVLLVTLDSLSGHGNLLPLHILLKLQSGVKNPTPRVPPNSLRHFHFLRHDIRSALRLKTLLRPKLFASPFGLSFRNRLIRSFDLSNIFGQAWPFSGNPLAICLLCSLFFDNPVLFKPSFFDCVMYFTLVNRLLFMSFWIHYLSPSLSLSKVYIISTSTLFRLNG